MVSCTFSISAPLLVGIVLVFCLVMVLMCHFVITYETQGLKSPFIYWDVVSLLIFRLQRAVGVFSMNINKILYSKKTKKSSCRKTLTVPCQRLKKLVEHANLKYIPAGCYQLQILWVQIIILLVGFWEELSL